MRFNFKQRSLKTSILIIPIILFILSIISTSVATSYLTNKTIRSAMEERGVELLKHTEENINDNKATIQITRDIMDDQLNLIGDLAKSRGQLTDDILVDIAKTTGAKELNYFNNSGVIINALDKSLLGWKSS